MAVATEELCWSDLFQAGHVVAMLVLESPCRGHTVMWRYGWVWCFFFAKLA